MVGLDVAYSARLLASQILGLKAVAGEKFAFLWLNTAVGG